MTTAPTQADTPDAADVEVEYAKDLTSLHAQTEGDGLDEREVRVTASTPDEDRDGDIVEPAGVQLEKFRQNPVLLWQHGHGEVGFKPIGTVTSIGVEGRELRATLHFLDPADFPDGSRGHKLAEFADMVLRLFQLECINAVSIGFRAPADGVESRDNGGRHFHESELTELSVVPLPSNPSATAVEREWSKRYGGSFQAKLDDWREGWTQMTEAKQDEDLPAPPDAVRDHLRTGLKWHEQGFSGDGMRSPTVEWARRMADGEAPTLDKAVKMHAWWARNISMDGPLREDGDPTPKAVAWKLWGGKPEGVAYTRRLMRILDRDISEALKTPSNDEGLDDMTTDRDAAEKGGMRHNERDRKRMASMRKMALAMGAGLDRMLADVDEDMGLEALPNMPSPDVLMRGMHDDDKAADVDAEKRLDPDQRATMGGILEAKQARLDAMQSALDQASDDGEIPPMQIERLLDMLHRDLHETKMLKGALDEAYADDETTIRSALDDLDGDDKATAPEHTKTVVEFQDFPLAARDREWDGEAAIEAWRDMTGSEDEPADDYLQIFTWFDGDAPENFGSYKLPIARPIDGEVHAVPRGVFAASAAVQGARGGVDIPDEDMEGVRAHLENYYAKMRSEFDDESIVAPWQTEEGLIDWSAKMSEALTSEPESPDDECDDDPPPSEGDSTDPSLDEEEGAPSLASLDSIPLEGVGV